MEKKDVRQMELSEWMEWYHSCDATTQRRIIVMGKMLIDMGLDEQMAMLSVYQMVENNPSRFADMFMGGFTFKGDGNFE